METKKVLTRQNKPTDEISETVEKLYKGIRLTFTEVFYYDFEVDENTGMVSDKLKEQKKGLKLNLDALDQYEIVSHKGIFGGIKFLITDTVNYRNSGYEVFEVDLNSKEVTSYLAPAFKQRLKL